MHKKGELAFCLLGTNGFHAKNGKFTDLLLQARVVFRTSKLKILRRRLADYVKKIALKSTCNTIIFPHPTNHIIQFVALSLLLPSSFLKLLNGLNNTDLLTSPYHIQNLNHVKPYLLNNINNINHKNYNFLNCDWSKKLLFPTNSLAKLSSDSSLLDSLLSHSLLSDSSTNQSHSKL